MSEETVATARQLTAALNGMEDRLREAVTASEERDQAIARYGHRTRLMTWLTVIGWALDVALTVVIAVVAVSAHDASTAASENRVSSLASCGQSNATRAAEIRLWDHIAALSITKKTPPKALAADENLLAYIRATFRPLDCARLYGAR
jgi:hypothetical protein